MAVYAGESGQDWVNAPEGVHDAVCVDVIDLGMQKTDWGEKPKIKIVWELGTKMEDGRPFVVSKQYNRTLSKNNAGVPSGLRKDLESWRGKPFTAEELRGPTGQGFDIEVLIGKTCQIFIKHNPGKKDPSKIYANAESILKPKVKLEPSGKYVRTIDRKASEPASKPAPTQEPVEEIPF